MKAHTAEVRPGRLDGAVRVPGSKSESHRAFLFAAQASEPCRVVGPLRCEDTQATLAGLHALGARLHLEADDVQFLPATLRPPTQAIDCRNSGTTLRLLAATCARFPAPATLTGDASLRGRPNGALLDALASLGVSCRSLDGKAPITVRGPLRNGAVTLPPGASSQFASALLLALAATPGPSSLTLHAPVASSPYVDLTLGMAKAFGVAIDEDPPTPAARTLRLAGPQRPQAASYHIGGDWSAAAFPLVAAAVTGGDVVVRGLRPDTLQGDRAIADHLGAFGARVVLRDDGVHLRGDPSALSSSGRVEVTATPDLFPALAVLAACSRGRTVFTGGEALRHKESDRIAAMADGLRRMGIEVHETPDGLEVQGGRLQGARLSSFGDHRVHMALTVAGFAAAGTSHVDDPACVAVSWPGFHDVLAHAGAPVTLLQGNRAEVSP